MLTFSCVRLEFTYRMFESRTYLNCINIIAIKYSGNVKLWSDILTMLRVTLRSMLIWPLFLVFRSGGSQSTIFKNRVWTLSGTETIMNYQCAVEFQLFDISWEWFFKLSRVKLDCKWVVLSTIVFNIAILITTYDATVKDL